MSCKGQEMPTLGILGMTAHKIGKMAQTMYAEYDLNKSQSMILFQLHRDGRISQKELAQKLNVSAPSITSMIQKMEKSGYIVRNVDEKDQRMMRLDLTEKGQACIEHVKAIAEKMDEIAFTGISPEEKMLLRRILFQICENVESDDSNHVNSLRSGLL